MSSQPLILKLLLASIFCICSQIFACNSVETQVANVILTGQYGPFLQLSAGTPPGTQGRSAIVSDQGTGALANTSPADMPDFVASIDFGDLVKGDGTPLTGAVGLRVRSNTGFRLVTSVTSFQATSLNYQGKDVSESDGGSFVRVWSGSVNATGSLATNPGLIRSNPQLNGGLRLSDLSQGPASIGSTFIIAGATASTGGTGLSPDNALEIPVFFSVPTGFELGPAPGASEGSFSFRIEFGLIGGA